MEVKGVNGTVMLDGGFVAIQRKGFLARAGVGKGEKRIPLRQITAVQFKPAGAMVNGFIQFSLGGGVERRSAFGRQSIDASSDENSVLFTKKQQPGFEELRTAIEHGITTGYGAPPPGPTAAPTPPPMPPPGPPGGQMVAHLNQLAELRRQGALTEQEFQAAKHQLLNPPR